MNNFVDQIQSINKNILKENVSLKQFNTLKLDGWVSYLIMPTTFLELKKVLFIIKRFNIKYSIIGNGSNIIFSNKRKECIIKLDFGKSKENNIFFASELLIVKANEFYNKGYKGLEYISNIPASIGGAIVMNAGAYNSFISDIIVYVYYLDEDLNFKVINKKDCDFLYRSSIFKNSNKIVLGCKVNIEKEDKDKLKKIRDVCFTRRRETQPVSFPNCGSVFKNGISFKAWELIDKVGLKGYAKNGAKISDKHCNFIVNINEAKYSDVIYLIKLIRYTVKKELSIELEEEVIILD